MVDAGPPAPGIPDELEREEERVVSRRDRRNTSRKRRSATRHPKRAESGPGTGRRRRAAHEVAGPLCRASGPDPERGGDPGSIAALRLQAEALNPDTWVTVEDIGKGLTEFEQRLGEMRLALGLRKRRRSRRGGRQRRRPETGIQPEPETLVGEHPCRVSPSPRSWFLLKTGTIWMTATRRRGVEVDVYWSCPVAFTEVTKQLSCLSASRSPWPCFRACWCRLRVLSSRPGDATGPAHVPRQHLHLVTPTSSSGTNEDSSSARSLTRDDFEVFEDGVRQDL